MEKEFPQHVEYIKISSLVLWSENPRDPITGLGSNSEIVRRALEEHKDKWDIPKLIKQMGDRYDFSELPTVVYHGNRPVVYDENRRMIVAMLALGLVGHPEIKEVNLEIPESIPCNVCEEKVALDNIYRKHVSSGTWKILERDYFLLKHANGQKSVLVALEEQLNQFVTRHPLFNQLYVRDELLSNKSLTKLGIIFKEGNLQSKHSPRELESILLDIEARIKDKKVSTRENRGDVYGVLSEESKQIIKNNENKEYCRAKSETSPEASRQMLQKTRVTPASKHKEPPFFGQVLCLKKGPVNNLYRDIQKLYESRKKLHLSENFPSILCMSLRLLCETAGRDLQQKEGGAVEGKNNGKPNEGMDFYVDKFFEEAKAGLTKQEKTALYVEKISTSGNLKGMLNVSAHSYIAGHDIKLAESMSCIIGQMLILSHGKHE